MSTWNIPTYLFGVFLTRSLGQASPSLNAFAAGQAAAYKMFETIKRKPKIDPYDTSGMVLEDVNGEIELKDVYFRYPARPDVQIFSGFSLQVPSGTTAALVGQSGSGKSTVISLVERFYDPDSGEVLIDGVDLKNLRLSWIREKIGLVSQEPILFATSIKENIAYGKANATDQEIRTAIELANAAKFIAKMPEVNPVFFERVYYLFPIRTMFYLTVLLSNWSTVTWTTVLLHAHSKKASFSLTIFFSEA